MENKQPKKAGIQTALFVLAIVALTGCTTMQGGYAYDSIARVYKQRYDGCFHREGWSGWSLQLTHDNPTEGSRQAYLIPDSLVKAAEGFAASGERVRLTLEGSRWDQDCERVTAIEAVAGGA